MTVEGPLPASRRDQKAMRELGDRSAAFERVNNSKLLPFLTSPLFSYKNITESIYNNTHTIKYLFSLSEVLFLYN